jgi:PAS domain S-box-containing protein
MDEKLRYIWAITGNSRESNYLSCTLSRLSGEGFQIKLSYGLEDDLKFSENKKPELIILDFSSDEEKEKEYFNKLRFIAIDAPIIILAKNTNEEFALSMIKSAAKDYIPTNTDSQDSILISVLNAIERARQMTMTNNAVEKESEAMLKMTNRILKFTNESIRIVMQSQNEKELFDNICHFLVEKDSYCLAWIAITNSNEKNVLKDMLYCSSDTRLDEIAQKAKNDFDYWLNSWAPVIEINNKYVNNDIKADPGQLFLLQEANKLDCKSLIVLPIIFMKKALGFLNVYSKEPEAFSQSDCSWLIDLTADIAFKLNTLRTLAEKAAQVELLQGKKRQAEFLIKALDGVGYKVKYDTMNFEFFDDKIEKLTGYSTEEINKIGFQSLIERTTTSSKESASVKKTKHKNEKEEAGEYRTDYFIKTKSGSLKWIEDHSFLWYDDNKTLIGAAGILTDISQRKLSEERLARLKNAEQEFKQLKENFLFSINHELISPMVVIQGFSEIMKRELPNSADREMAESIYSSGSQLTQTLNSVLELSRIEGGKINLRDDEINLIELVEEIISADKESANKKGLSLNVITNYKTLIIKSDERLLKIVINNLINNAVKFTKQGGVNINIELTDFDKNQKHVVIRVSDTGIGIPEEGKDLIWKEFRQLSEGLSRRYEGAGLGLTIAKKYAAALKGSIEVESVVGEGSVFSFKFAVQDVNFEAKRKTVVHRRKIRRESIPSHQESPKVLVVDDDEASRSIMSVFLSESFTYDVAKDADEAIEKLLVEKYDAILMDINLGKGKTGIEAARQIRKLDGYRDTPIIAITAFALQGDVEEVFSSGCTHYISKPLDKAEFVPFIKRIVKGA